MPQNFDVAVLDAIKFPTVSCVPVAIIPSPDEFETKIEFGEREKPSASVPAEVTGFPEMVKPPGTVMSTDVTPPELPPTHAPFTAKHPVAILIPLLNVDVAVPYASNCAAEDVPVTASALYGDVVPIPTLPELSMMKLVAVDEPTTNWFEARPAIGFTANVANGEVEPVPKTPLLVMVSGGASVAVVDDPNVVGDVVAM